MEVSSLGMSAPIPPSFLLQTDPRASVCNLPLQLDAHKPLPPPPRILIESNKTSPIESIRVSFLLESLFFPSPPSLLFCHVPSFDPSRSYPRQDSSSRRRGRGRRRREGPRRKKERGRIRKRRRRRRRRRRKEFLLLLLPPRHRLSAMSSGLRGTNASSRPPPPLFFLIYPDFVERRRQITSLAF